MYLDRAKEQFQILQRSKKGCSETFSSSVEEVQKLEKDIGFLLPEAYKEFLLWIGAGGGPLEGQHFTDSRVQANRERAIATMRRMATILVIWYHKLKTFAAPSFQASEITTMFSFDDR